MNQFEDIGRPGYLRVRDRSCHRCESCWAGRSHECTEPSMQHFPAELVELDPYTPPERPVTRSALTSEGIALSQTVQPDDFIAVEIDDLQTPWMLFRAIGKAEMYTGPEERWWMGKIMPGDELLWGYKMAGVGSTFTLTAEKSPIFIEDVRAAKLALKEINTRTSTRSTRGDQRSLQRFTLSSNDKAKICSAMPLDLDVRTKTGLRATYYA